MHKQSDCVKFNNNRGGWGEECSLDSITSFDDLVDSNDSDCRIL